MNIFHRDLKSANVFLYETKASRFNGAGNLEK